MRGYWVVARSAAALLSRIDGVEGVYVTGSLTRSDRIVPGRSDIDLVAIVEVPTLRDELRLRSAFRRVLRVVNAAGPLFKHLDYVERQDLPWFQGLGNTWSLSLAEGSRRLSGTGDFEHEVRVPPEKWRLERLATSLRRWQSASSFLLDGGDGREPLLNAIGSRRTLAEVLSAWLGLPRFTPLESLLEGARSRADGMEALQGLASDPRRAVPRFDPEGGHDFIAASLEVLEAFAAEVASGWNGRWPPEALIAKAGERPVGRDDAPIDGFSALFDVSGPYGNEESLLLAAPGATARLAVARLLRWLRMRKPSSVARVPRPTLLTAPLWQAAALLEPSPFVGAELALAPRRRWGEPWPAPPRPEGAAWDHLIMGRAADLTYRPRGRGLRFGVTLAEGLQKLRHDVLTRGRALSSLLGVSASNFVDDASIPNDEEALLGELRGLLATLRPLFADRVNSHRGASERPG